MTAISTNRSFGRLFLYAVIAAIASAVVRPSAAAVAFPDPLSLSPLESRMLTDPADGQFRQFSLIDAALIASGVSRDDELDRYRQRYAIWLRQSQQVCRREESSTRKAEALFELLHREVLTHGYDALATELTHPFDDGKFNCASASLLFTALATDCGLDVSVIERPRHAMCILNTPGERTLIETTCPNWFQLTPALRRQAEQDVITRSAAGERQGKGQQIGPAALVAVIYYNRGVDLLQEKRFAEAVSVNLRALRLEPDNETARGNLLASINNWSLSLCEQGEYANAADLLARGLDIAPDHEAFRANQRHVYRTWIQALAAAGRQREALAVLAAARQADPDSPLWNIRSVKLLRSL